MRQSHARLCNDLAVKILVSLLLAHIFSMLGFSSYAAALTLLQALWQLSNTEAGLIASGFFMGYMVSVSMWSAMTDRRDARQVYALGCFISASASLGFGLFAQGFVSAMAFQLLLGTGVAATYMPGLRILAEGLQGEANQSRAVSFYTAFFGIGVAGSLVLSGWAIDALGWRWAMALPAAGPLMALGLMVYATGGWGLRQQGGHAARPNTPKPTATPIKTMRGTLELIFPIGAWRRALREKAVVGYTVGYGVHCLELFGSRSWTVAFLAFVVALHPDGTVPMAAATMAAVVNLLSVPASILGNEMALRVGRRAWIVLVMTSGSLMGVTMSLLADSHWMLVFVLVGLHSMLIMADSATLTAGLVASAPQEVRGAALGFYSLMGFGAGAVGPALFGLALDLSGGATEPVAWAMGFLALGLGCLAYPLIDRRLFGSSPFERKRTGRTTA
jgi:MFS family permease